MIMDLSRLIVLLAFFMLSACSEEPDCYIADRVQLVKPLELKGEPYVLYWRTTGFHEKVFFFELYKSPVTFDSCGRSNSTAELSTPYDHEMGFPGAIHVSRDNIEIVYSDLKDSGQSFNTVPVRVH